MGKGIKIGVIVVIVALLAGGIAWALTSDSKTNNDENSAGTTEHSEEVSNKSVESNSNTPVAATITYTSNGFDPETTAVKSGDKVKVVNTSGSLLDFGSDPHPTHTDNPELNAGDIEDGQSKTFTVTTKGDWGFHNHFNPSDHAFIKVE